MGLCKVSLSFPLVLFGLGQAVQADDASLDLFYAQYAYFSTPAIGQAHIQYSYSTNTISITNNTTIYSGASDPNFGASSVAIDHNTGNLLVAGGGTSTQPGYVFNITRAGAAGVPYQVSPDTTPGAPAPRAYALKVVPPNASGFPVNYLIANEKEYGYGRIALLPLSPSLGSGVAYPVTGDDLYVTSVAFDANGVAYYASGTSSSNVGNFGTITFDGSKFTTYRLFGQPVGSDFRGGIVYGGNHALVFDPFTGDILAAGGDGIGQYDPATHLYHWLTPSIAANGFQFSDISTDGKGHIFLAACCGDPGLNGNGAGDLVIVDYSSAPGHLIDASTGVHVKEAFLASNLGGIAPDLPQNSPGVPIIFLQPEDTSAFPGQTATFSAGASGVNLSYQWQSKPSGASSFAPIADATSSSYSAGPVSASDNGTQFRCVVSNSQGSVTTDAATLTVLPPSTAFINSVTLGTLRNNYSGWVGMSVTVGPFPLSVTALGRISVSGNTHSHLMKIVDAATLQDLPGTSVAVAGYSAPSGAFSYGNLHSPVTLRANSTYYVLTQETAGGDSWYDWNTTAQTTGVGAMSAAVYGTPYTTVGAGGHLFGPVDFKYASFVGVAVNPANVTLTDGGTQQFAATVTGTSDNSVTWSLSPSVGTISSTGQYQAPARISSTQMVTAKATSNADPTAYGTATVTLQPSAKVQFLITDAATQGNWKSAYGSEGYVIVGDAALSPSYATVTASGQFQWTWTSSTSDARALQKSAAPDRVAAAWYSATSFNIDINPNDANTHQVALYLLDWNGEGRIESIGVIDGNTGSVLDTRSVASFTSGIYLVWSVTGHVRIQVTRSTGSNAVLSGIFFGFVTPPPPSSSASFIKTDTTTQGNWKSAYGADGYNVLGDSVAYPAYATIIPSGQTLYVWSSSTTDARGLQKANTSDRIAAAWYATNNITLDVNISGATVRQLALYFLDWDGAGRAETVTIIDAPTRTLLDTRSLSNFSGGQYLVWNITGHVILQINRTAGPNALFSGIFFGAGSITTPPAASAQFINADGTTQGNWKSSYGADGYNVIGDSASYPAYAAVAPAGQSLYVWAASTASVQALQKASAFDRIAATWYSGTAFTLDLNVTGSTAHQVALYFLDWDASGRTQTVTVADAQTGTVLDSRSVANFAGGQYLVWNVSGHIVIQITRTAGPNAVLSGIFFGGPVSPPPLTTASFTGVDTTTGGSWKGTYGMNGFNVIGDSAQYPVFATVTPSGQLTWTWAQSSSDIRALQKSSATDRIAASWYSGSVFTLDISFIDGNSHQIAIYLLDWDNRGRSQRVDALDAANGHVLDSRAVSNFGGGVYLTLTATGHIQLQFTNLSAPNAVLSGLFF